MMRTRFPAWLVVSLLFATSLFAASADTSPGSTILVSVASDGTQANSDSAGGRMSADTRYVAFWSAASNLVGHDLNDHADIFVHDRESGQTELVSLASDGAQGNDGSFGPSISADGRYIAFMSSASNLVSMDTNECERVEPDSLRDGRQPRSGSKRTKDTVTCSDIFIHDRETRETTLVSVDSRGRQGNDASEGALLSADGRYVAFTSSASNLVPGDTNETLDVFVHDRQTGETTRVSVASDGSQGDLPSHGGSISADGRFVAFTSAADNLVPEDGNEDWDVFIHDRQTAQTTRISDSGRDPSLSTDGFVVAFESSSSAIVPGDSNEEGDVFVYDRRTGHTEIVSISSNGEQGDASSAGASLSGDGRYVTFYSIASNIVQLTPGSESERKIPNVLVRDRQAGTTSIISVAIDGSAGNNDSYDPSVSVDGRYVTFNSFASNLVPGDTNPGSDIFMRRWQADQLPSPTDTPIPYTASTPSPRPRDGIALPATGATGESPNRPHEDGWSRLALAVLVIGVTAISTALIISSRHPRRRGSP